MNVLAIGTDIVECLRIAKLIERHGEQFINRVYTRAEVRFCQRRAQATQHFAGRWAAKEAVLRLLGIGPKRGIHYRDMEIRSSRNGQLTVGLRGGIRDLVVSRGIRRILISVSISRSHAVAYALALGVEPEEKPDGGLTA